MPGQMVYFLSDFHLGVPDHASSTAREKRIVAFLEEAAKDATEIHILGDLFDMWFEYKQVVPRGFTRLLGKLSELKDRGIPVHIHIGNHDMWAFDYLPKETGVTLHQEPIVREWNGKRLYIGHGDGLGPGDHGYKFIRKVFRNKLMQWCFARLHPNFGLGIAHFWSGRSRKKNYENDRKWLGADKEWLVQYCQELLTKEHFDFLIFGHRHLPVDLELVLAASRDPAGTVSAAGSAWRDPAGVAGTVTSGSPAGVAGTVTSGSPAGVAGTVTSGSPAGVAGTVTSGSPAGDPEGTVSRYINLGDWITHFTYAVFDGGGMRLMKRVGDGALDGDVRISGGPAV